MSLYEREYFYNDFSVQEQFIDAPLTDEGKIQAAEAAPKLPAQIHNIVFVSPLCRAI